MMPQYREGIPRVIQPWIYLLIATTFQFSGGVYMGSLHQMMGAMDMMMEDVLMCLYCNLAGMAIYFPILLRMKFRFTNKTLLTAAATGVLLCNLAVPYITFKPLLWLVCFFSGMCKIQGTFECMSNIQLWMTPKRDFTVFFPILNAVILGSMQLSDLLCVHFIHHYHWTCMHWFMCGVMLLNLIFIRLCIKDFRFMRKFPLFGIDWAGSALWAALLVQIAFFFTYGDYYDWFNSKVMRILLLTILCTLCMVVRRMTTIRHPYIEPKMWTYRRLVPVLIVITIAEAFLVTEHVLEEIFLSEIMHYEETVSVKLDWGTLTGVWLGCVFCYWWAHIKRFNYLRLIGIGFFSIIIYLVLMYFSISTEIHISRLYLPVIFRGFAYAIMSITFLICLHELVSFPHFFQSLSILQMLHMVVGGVLGAAAYKQGMSYYVPDNISRYSGMFDRIELSKSHLHLEEQLSVFTEQVMQISLKQIYGWTIYACVLTFLLLLMWDSPVRKQLKKIPIWKDVRRQIKNSFWRTSHRIKPTEDVG